MNKNLARTNVGHRQRAGQTSFMVMIMMIIAILLAMFFWFSAGSDYAQNAASAARNRGDIFGRTAGDAIAPLEEGGSVTILAGIEGGALRLAVQDDGPGLPAAATSGDGVSRPRLPRSTSSPWSTSCSCCSSSSW